MQRIEYLIGWRRTLFNQLLKLSVFFHFARETLAGRFPAKKLPGFLKRLLYFLSKMRENKYVKVGSMTKINLYVPAFPSKAFYKACRKVAETGVKQPCITALLSVTSGCRFRCEHCYQKHDIGKDAPIEFLTDAVRTLDAMGVSFFNFEGGDPFLVYDRLKAVCEAVGTGEIWINTTGDGISAERLEELTSLGVKGLIFSLHSPDEDAVNAFMGRDDAWSTIMRGMERCRESGLDVAVNACLATERFADGSFERLMDLTRSLGVSIIQLIKPKPSGGWLDADLPECTQADLERIGELVRRYNNRPEYRDYPFIAAQILDERSEMFGCTAGGSDRFYINAKGDVQPCEFLNISFGNIQDEPFEDIYTRMREVFDVPGDRWLCETCSGLIRALHQQADSRSLPLSPELSTQVYRQWDRGACPEFYKIVEKRH